MTDIGLSISNFSLKIAHSLITEVNKNVSFSPASIYVALAMLSSGSKEETSKELKELLGEDFSVLTTQKPGGSTVEQSISKVIETLCKSTELKNKIYTQILFAQPYLISTEKVFKTQCEQISFEKPEAATLTMNNWVKENTKGRIDKLIEESLIKPDTGLVLINTIYFKADWETKFDKSETRPAKFTLEDGKKISVQMMYNDGREEIYEEEEKYISLKRKFNNSTIVGLFILPQKGKMLKDFLLSFKMEDLKKCVSETSKLKTDVYIPKCMIKMDKNISDILKKCGLVNTFDRERCNLKSMADDNLFVSDVCHSSVVSISEEGVEAAAATSVMIGLRLAVMSFEFIVNRPFIFIIYDTALDIPLFINAIYDPTQK